MSLFETIESAGWRRLITPASALWLAVAVLAMRLGPLSERALQWDAWVFPSALAATVLAASVVVEVLGRAIRLCWLGYGIPGLVAAPLRAWRRKRWERAERLAATATGDARQRYIAQRNSVALAYPVSPTWMGDRRWALEIRVRNEYGLDVASVWPRLWTLLPNTIRSAVTAAQSAYCDASRWMAWALVYAVSAAVWWPALVVAVPAAVLGVMRGRIAMAALTELAEAAVDLYGIDLARELGVVGDKGVLSEADGREINKRTRKSA
jgi:hypothetical protein